MIQLHHTTPRIGIFDPHYFEPCGLALKVCVKIYRSWNVPLHHRNADQFAPNGTLRGRNKTLCEQNETFWERNASKMECFAFLGTERFVLFGLVFNFPRYSDFLAWRIGLLFIFATQDENKFHLIRSTCSFAKFFFDLKKDLSRLKLLILSIYLNNCVYKAIIMISIWASTLLKIVTLIECLYMY